MDRQKEIARMAHNNGGQISRQEIVHALGRTYFRNGGHHLQAAIGRMIKKGTLKRIGRGLYKLVESPVRSGYYSDDPDQGSLFANNETDND